jgi:hypothetical protein
MLALTKTQFAFITPNTQGLPPHLVKKLEEAIARAHIKAKSNTQSALNSKLARAQRIREQKQI